MEEKWKIEYYKTANGESPIKGFIGGLDVKVQNKIFDVLDLLKEFGINLGMPHSKKLAGTPLWELRILGSDNIRILYITQRGKTFLLLHGFLKKKQKTDKKELRMALNRLLEHKDRTQN